MPGNDNAPATAGRGAIRNQSPAGISVSLPSYDATSRSSLQRRALRRLLNQIDLDEQLRKRAIQQAISEAEAWFWCWRAEQFDAAAPREGDYHGNLSTGEPPWMPHICNAACRARRDQAAARCKATALACRRKAAFLEWEAGGELVDPAGEP